MNIALIGYGKMGHAIEQVATQRGHNIVLRISSANKDEMTPENLQKADVAIEFTNPEAAKDNVLSCLGAGVNTISGSTGWNKYLPDAEQCAKDHDAAFLHASNFSVGVNVFFEVNKMLARLMNEYADYDILIEETHHTKKKDAPSGTAITIAEQILQHLSARNRWVLNDTNEPDAIPIMAYRLDEVPGTHKVTYSSPVDSISIEHIAHNRNGFALGAVMAAEFVAGRKGIYSMKDVLFPAR